MKQWMKYLWVFFAGLALVVGLGGFWLERSVAAELEQGLRQDLKAILDGKVATLSEWMLSMEHAATLAVSEPGAREATLAIIEASRTRTSDDAVFAMPEQEKLRQILEPVLRNWEFVEYAVVADGRVVGTRLRCAMKREVRAENLRFLDRLSRNESMLSPPQMQEQCKGDPRLPRMWVASPIRDEKQNLLGALAFAINPRESFTRILGQNSFGATGETFAFDNQGRLLSESRFNNQLRAAGLIGETETSLLNLEMRVPGGDITEPGFQLRKGQRMLMDSVASAISGETDTSIEGYTDYRGREVVGAWTWLSKHDFGVVTEIDSEEAFKSLSTVRSAFKFLVVALGLMSGALLIASQVIVRLQKHAGNQERLGQYTLEEKLGQGGMGSVYLAHHAMLRRPTAIKVIRPDHVDERTLSRFEREVQATAALCHPNTIAVYDYGRSSDGVFYYAMEFLEGTSLHGLVQKNGPQRQERVIHLLLQILGSLAEAHEQGMVHRDVKPANIMLCERGGISDVIKVLDFGLVKDLTSSERLTVENSLTGTPHFMAPEAVTDQQTVDARSDIYAVGAVAYFLLTARFLFEGPSMMAVLKRHVSDAPAPPSEHTILPIDPEFEALILACLAKSQEDRPRSARVLMAELAKVRDSAGLVWTQEEAHRWWEKQGDLFAPQAPVPLSGAPTVQVRLDGRPAARSSRPEKSPSVPVRPDAPTVSLEKLPTEAAKPDPRNRTDA